MTGTRLRDYAKTKAGKDDVKRAPCPEITVEIGVDIGAIGDIKDMGVDHLIGVMEELFTHPTDVNWK